MKPAFLLILTVALLACRDNLDEKPYSSRSGEQVFQDEDGLKKATLGVYHIWTSLDYNDIWNRFILSESGHRYATGGILGAGANPYYRFGHLPTSGAFDLVWSRMYKVIFRANTVIGNARKAVSADSTADKYIAEARLLRAYAYFNLARDFGGVPLINREIKSLEDQDLIYAPRASLEEVYQLILEDLSFAEKTLPDRRDPANTGRVTAATAKGLLGKVYLYMAGKPLSRTEYYPKAIEKLTELTNAEARYNLGLVPEFADVFSLRNERNQEILLSFAYFTDASNPNGTILPFFLFPRGLTNGDEQTSYGLTWSFYQLFGKTDSRRDRTVVSKYAFKGAENGGAVPGDSILYDPKTWHYRIKRTGEIFFQPNFGCGVAYGKMDRTERQAGAPPHGYGNDLIELRYADVLLLLAEALIETGRPDQALPLINRIRERAHATKLTGAANLRAALRLERRLELTGEFNTVYDIRRWGTLREEVAAMTPDMIIGSELTPYQPRFELYPIPQSQLDANPNLKQNAGW